MEATKNKGTGIPPKQIKTLPPPSLTESPIRRSHCKKSFAGGTSEGKSEWVRIGVSFWAWVGMLSWQKRGSQIFIQPLEIIWRAMADLNARPLVRRRTLYPRELICPRPKILSNPASLSRQWGGRAGENLVDSRRRGSRKGVSISRCLEGSGDPRLCGCFNQAPNFDLLAFGQLPHICLFFPILGGWKRFFQERAGGCCPPALP